MGMGHEMGAELLAVCNEKIYKVHVNMRNASARSFVEMRASQGRVLFSLVDLCASTGLSGPAARAQLRRLPQVVRVAPRGDLFLYVAPEHRLVGAPPYGWWLDACFAHWKEPYYVGLLSAAALLGASHQAVQVVQVVVSTAHPRRELRIGRLRIKFFQRKDVAEVPVFEPSPAHAPLRVSTAGATMLDVVRYAKRLGGIGRACEVVEELVPVTKKSSLREALAAGFVEASAVQRLGLILDGMGADGLANVAENWLSGRRLAVVLLDPGQGASEAGDAAEPWMVIPNVKLETKA